LYIIHVHITVLQSNSVSICIMFILLYLSFATVINCRTSEIVTNEDLKFLMMILDGNLNENAKWENVIDKRNDHLCYNAKSCKPKVTDFILQLGYRHYYNLSWLLLECIAHSFFVSEYFNLTKLELLYDE
jgi:hypothetical protein